MPATPYNSRAGSDVVLLGRCIETLQNVKANLEVYQQDTSEVLMGLIDSGEPEEQIVDLHEYILSYGRFIKETQLKMQVLDDINRNIPRGGSIQMEDVEEAKQRMQQLCQEIDDDEIMRSEAFRNCAIKIRETYHPNEAADDDDLVVTQAEQNVICPISQQVMKDPVKSKLCKHSYSKEAVMALLKQQKGRTPKCPAVGCDQKLFAHELEPDLVMAQAVKRHLRQQAARESQVNDDAVVL
eukprot:Colp12_sorted_trinity150504_noHs@29169